MLQDTAGVLQDGREVRDLVRWGAFDDDEPVPGAMGLVPLPVDE